MGKINHTSILDAKVDCHRGTAQTRMRFRAGVRIRESAQPRNVARELEDPPIVDLVDHPNPTFNTPYIGREKAEIEGLRTPRAKARR